MLLCTNGNHSITKDYLPKSKTKSYKYAITIANLRLCKCDQVDTTAYLSEYFVIKIIKVYSNQSYLLTEVIPIRITII